MDERTGANMQDMARAIEIWKHYLPANSRTQLERQGRRYWAGIALALAQYFFSNNDVAACASQLRAAKDYGTVAGIVCVGCAWKGKCFFTAQGVNAPYLRCANSAGEFALPSSPCSCELRATSDTNAQRKALARKFAPGLLRPFSGMNVSVRLGEIAHSILSRWPIRPQPAKPIANFCYVTMCDRAHWLMLRESLFSLHRSWTLLPEITVVSDGTWTPSEFGDVFAWWPAPITVLTRQQICEAASSADLPELTDYARESPYGLKLAAIVIEARKRPVLFVDADILWFEDPLLLLGEPTSWAKPRALRESNCHQRREMALRHCAQVLEPPFVNSGIVALHGELMRARSPAQHGARGIAVSSRQFVRANHHRRGRKARWRTIPGKTKPG